MKALQFPFSIDINGHVATANTYPGVVRGQVIDALMTNWFERVMRAPYGCNVQGTMFDPLDDLMRSDAINQILQRIHLWSPRAVISVFNFVTDTRDPGKLWIEVEYRAGPYMEAQSLRLPANTVLSEETAI